MNDIYIGQLVSPNTLKHYGILGMKWGIRRYQYEDGTLTPAGKKRYAKDQERIGKSLNKEYERVKKKTRNRAPEDENRTFSRKALESPAILRAHTMSDEELAEAIKRLKKEAEYIDLVKKTNPGKQYVNDILGSVGKKVAVTAAAGGTLYALKIAVSGEKADPIEFGKAVFKGGADKKK